jgi:hypothetical protein
MGFYGSHNQDYFNASSQWLVGLAMAPKLAGPWTRCPWLNPSDYIETPGSMRVAQRQPLNYTFRAEN